MLKRGSGFGLPLHGTALTPWRTGDGGIRRCGRGRIGTWGAAVLAAFFILQPEARAGTGNGEPAAARRRSVAPPHIPGARLLPLAFADLDGWREDDAAAAFAAFLVSCRALALPPTDSRVASAPVLHAGLRHACAMAGALGTERPAREVARLFFEANFRPYRVMPDGEGKRTAFFTGYYEPEVTGALTPGNGFDVPVHRRPDELAESGPRAPFPDRAAIEDGALAGRGLEIVYLKDPVDLFFMQIQGSARVRLPDGTTLRLSYDGTNGHPYTAVGARLIASGQVPREEMSMARIRAFMTDHPEAGRALRRTNRSYVFFKADTLAADAGARGAQGVPLTAGRSLAVDRKLHTYGTPIFVEAALPVSAPRSAESFRRLMIAQDTGSAIVGPARADLFFGAGQAAETIAGRIRHGGHFTVLVPRFTEADPS